jgi:hypothetical protein
MFLDGKEDLTAFADFPPRHWKKIQFTNRLERINREIKRRTDVVQAFPNQLREQQLQGETGPLTVAGSSCAASPHDRRLRTAVVETRRARCPVHVM